jgi:hypothetical protein
MLRMREGRIWMKFERLKLLIRFYCPVSLTNAILNKNERTYFHIVLFVFIACLLPGGGNTE